MGELYMSYVSTKLFKKTGRGEARKQKASCTNSEMKAHLNSHLNPSPYLSYRIHCGWGGNTNGIPSSANEYTHLPMLILSASGLHLSPAFSELILSVISSSNIVNFPLI